MFKRIYEIPGSSRNLAMEGLRGYAVFLVFCVHFCGTFAISYRSLNFDVLSFSQLLKAGINTEDWILFYLFKSHYGVDLFFLLSGFLIYKILILKKDNFSYRNYLYKRILRVFPLFILCLVFATFIYTKILRWQVFEVGRFVKNLLLLNGIPQLGVEPYLPPTWSLFYEISFYIIAPSILIFNKLITSHFLKLLIFSFTIISITYAIEGDYVQFIMFLAGGFLAISEDKLYNIAKLIPDTFSLVIYLLSTIYFAYSLLNYKIFIPIYALTSSLLFINTCYGKGYLNKIFSFSPFRYLGNISYSFYLLHLPCLALVFANIHAVFQVLGINPNPSTTAFFIFSLGLALSIISSTLTFIMIEKRYFTHKNQ